MEYENIKRSDLFNWRGMYERLILKKKIVLNNDNRLIHNIQNIYY